jgi:hydroxymethylbilane synthase
LTRLKIGTRGSALALWQARTVAAVMESAGAAVEIVVIRTAGDRLQTAPLSEIGGKRLFVKEIEDALLGRQIDVAVHSAKDMSAVLPEGLEVVATLPREDPRDVLVLRDGVLVEDFAAALAHLGDTASIGTGSVRRVAQLSAQLPRATFAAIRGNVDTRLRKLDAGDSDALVLAAAGMRRLGLAARISAYIPVEVCVPAPGQGIVAIEIRSDDESARGVLAAASDPAAMTSLTAERAVVTALGGGCQLPLGAIALHERDTLRMHGIVASPDGLRRLQAKASGPVTDPEAVGRRLAEALAREGAMEILEAIRAASSAQPPAGGEQ